jgi:hypothetical protein
MPVLADAHTAPGDERLLDRATPVELPEIAPTLTAASTGYPLTTGPCPATTAASGCGHARLHTLGEALLDVPSRTEHGVIPPRPRGGTRRDTPGASVPCCGRLLVDRGTRGLG